MVEFVQNYATIQSCLSSNKLCKNFKYEKNSRFLTCLLYRIIVYFNIFLVVFIPKLQLDIVLAVVSIEWLKAF